MQKVLIAERYCRRLLTSVFLIALANAAGCNSETPISPSAEGVYALQAVDGVPLPAQRGMVRVIGRDSTDFSQDCRYVIDSGSLQLELAASTFLLEYTARNSCTNQQLPGSVLSGTFALDGSTLAFEEPISGLPPMTFSGTIAHNQALVQLPDMLLRFAR